MNSLPKPYYESSGVTLHLGDCRAVLAGLEPESVDAVVTDPPYNLTEPRSGTSFYSGSKDHPRSEDEKQRRRGGFMGKAWDGTGIAFDPDLWTEVLRVLKPGGHLLAMGSTRTFHRLAVAIEDAGFELRDTLAWLHGQGFPKNHDVSKRIRQQLPEDALCACGRHSTRTVQDSQADCPGRLRSDDAPLLADQDTDRGVVPSRVGVRVHSRDDQHGDGLDGSVTSIYPDGGNGRPSSDYSLSLDVAEGSSESDHNRHLGTSSNRLHDESTVEHKSPHRISDKSHSDDDSASSSHALPSSGYANLPYCTTCGGAVVQDGLGTALKPAMELIVLARKPFPGTVAANVLEHGTGALNVDGCRVGHTDPEKWTTRTSENTMMARKAQQHADYRPAGDPYSGEIAYRKHSIASASPNGRWPANVILSHHPECVPVGTKRVKGQQSQGLKDTPARSWKNTSKAGINRVGHADADGMELVEAWRCHENCPVAMLDAQSGNVRSSGDYPTNYSNGRGYNGVGAVQGPLYSDSGGASRFFKTFAPDEDATRFRYQAKAPASERRLPDGSRSTHPTQKPLALMRYLCRLITPPGGMILDPFIGSGTTAVAAQREGFRIIGIDESAEYLKIAVKRLSQQVLPIPS